MADRRAAVVGGALRTSTGAQRKVYVRACAVSLSDAASNVGPEGEPDGSAAASDAIHIDPRRLLGFLSRFRPCW